MDFKMDNADSDKASVKLENLSVAHVKSPQSHVKLENPSRDQ